MAQHKLRIASVNSEKILKKVMFLALRDINGSKIFYRPSKKLVRSAENSSKSVLSKMNGHVKIFMLIGSRFGLSLKYVDEL